MKTLATLITIIVLTLPASAQAHKKEIRADIDKDIPLAEAIRRANEQFQDVQPLTEQEVIAAVQAIKLAHPDIKEAIYEIYQRVVKERVLPKGMYFSHIPAWHTPYGHFAVDWKDLTLQGQHVAMTDEQKEELKKSLGGISTQFTFVSSNQVVGVFNYRIRARFISSQPLTESEAKTMNEKTKGVEQGPPPKSR